MRLVLGATLLLLGGGIWVAEAQNLTVEGQITAEGTGTHSFHGGVAIGTDSPNATLHVNGPSGSVPARVQIGGSSRLTVGSNGGVTVGTFDDTPPVRGLYVYGDVGIGTSSPSAKLHVMGDLRLGSTQGSLWGADRIVGYDDLRFYTDNAGSTPRMFITGSGKVGVGTTSPAFRLEVDSSGSSEYYPLFLRGVAGTLQTGAGSASYWHFFTDRPAYYFNKKVYCEGGCLTYSTREKKQDIRYLTGDDEDEVLRSLSDLKMVRFRYKGKDLDDEVHLGFIAEEAPKQILSADGKAVHLYDYTSYAITAIKAQQKTIAAQQQRLDELEARLARLERAR
jgi:hypothetical protein